MRELIPHYQINTDRWMNGGGRETLVLSAPTSLLTAVGGARRGRPGGEGRGVPLRSSFRTDMIPDPYSLQGGADPGEGQSRFGEVVGPGPGSWRSSRAECAVRMCDLTSTWFLVSVSGEGGPGGPTQETGDIHEGAQGWIQLVDRRWGGGSRTLTHFVDMRICFRNWRCFR